jgi:hypothetical protein
MAASFAVALLAGEAIGATLIGTLPGSATEATLLAVECTNDGAGEPASLTIQVRDLAPISSPVVSLQARRGFSAKSTTDAGDGDATASPSVAVNGGAGRYDVFVDKNAEGGEDFEVTAQCWTGTGGTGVPTGTSLFATQGGAVPIGSIWSRIAMLGGLGVMGLASIASRSSVGRLRTHGGKRRGMARSSSLLTALFTALASALGTLVAAEARAHSQSGSLGAAASATDYYEIACFDDGRGPATSLEVQIRDSSPGAAPFVSAQAHFGLTVRSVSDDLIADIVPSPRIFLNGGSVSYIVLVDKSGAGGKFYELTYHCWTGPDGTGLHTGSNLVTRQSE